VVYEIEAMCRAAARYAEDWGAKLHQATPWGWEDAVFFLEASLGHARALVMAFGYPGRNERRLVKALGIPKGYEKTFRQGFSHASVTTDRAHGQLSELIGYIGQARWDAPFGIDVHQPVEVAYSVLDALDSCRATTVNAALKAAVDKGRERLTAAV
jgi:hypothetical protein